MNLRSFKLLFEDNNKTIHKGRYYGNKPIQVAKKALCKLYNKYLRIHPPDVIHFSLKETTKNSKHKIISYFGSRLKLDKEIQLELRSNPHNRSEIPRSVTIKYKYVVKKAYKI